MKKIDFEYKVCEMTIKYKSKIPASERKKVICSYDMAQSFMSIYDKDTIGLTETAYAMVMNSQMSVIGIICVGIGTSTETMMDLRKIIQAALLCNGRYVAICHNHPSYNLNPSKQDDAITERVKMAAESMGLRLIDHIILDPDGNYYSYNDEGKI